MNQTLSSSHEDLQLHDKRHTRGRFSWVKRLVQGQSKGLATGIRTPPYEPNVGLESRKHTGHLSDDNSTRRSVRSTDFGSDEESASTHSDNISTIPLKSVTSRTSTTHSPSVLSAENHQNPDNSSFVASTAETSLSPSTHVSLSPSIRAQTRGDGTNIPNISHSMGPRERERERERERDRDSESIITLASSTRRIRRRSIDTNCSTAGIPPASIMERLSVHPAPNMEAQDLE